MPTPIQFEVTLRGKTSPPQPELDPLDHFNYTALLFSKESCEPSWAAVLPFEINKLGLVIRESKWCVILFGVTRDLRVFHFKPFSRFEGKILSLIMYVPIFHLR